MVTMPMLMMLSLSLSLNSMLDCSLLPALSTKPGIYNEKQKATAVAATSKWAALFAKRLEHKTYCPYGTVGCPESDNGFLGIPGNPQGISQDPTDTEASQQALGTHISHDWPHELSSALLLLMPASSQSCACVMHKLFLSASYPRCMRAQSYAADRCMRPFPLQYWYVSCESVIKACFWQTKCCCTRPHLMGSKD